MICTENTDNIIHVFGRKDRNPYHKTINFTPYFYIKHPAGKYKSIFGDNLKKIECKLPSDVPKLREGLLHHEADVIFTNRALIDLYTLNNDGTIFFPKNRDSISWEELKKFNDDIKNKKISSDLGDNIG